MKKGFYAIIAALCVIALVLGVFFFQAKGEVNSLHNEMAALQKGLEENEATISSLTKQTEDQMEEIGSLTSAAADRDTKIEELTAEVTDRDSKIEELGAQVADRDSKIEELGTEVADRDSKIEELGTEVADRDSKIEELGAEVADRDSKIEELGAEVTDRDSKIEELGAEVADRDTKIEELGAEVADRDSKIEDLRDQLTAAQSGTEDLSAVREGTYHNTKRLIRRLQEEDIHYSVTAAKEGSGEDDTVIIPLQSDSLNGVHFTYTFTVFLDEDNSRASLKVWNLIDYSASNANAVRAACDDLNYSWHWAKFYTDPGDNSVTVDLDVPLMDAPGMGDLLWDALVSLDQVISISYDDLLSFRI